MQTYKQNKTHTTWPKHNSTLKYTFWYNATIYSYLFSIVCRAKRTTRTNQNPKKKTKYDRPIDGARILIDDVNIFV